MASVPPWPWDEETFVVPGAAAEQHVQLAITLGSQTFPVRHQQNSFSIDPPANDMMEDAILQLCRADKYARLLQSNSDNQARIINITETKNKMILQEHGRVLGSLRDEQRTHASTQAFLNACDERLVYYDARLKAYDEQRVRDQEQRVQDQEQRVRDQEQHERVLKEYIQRAKDAEQRAADNDKRFNAVLAAWEEATAALIKHSTV